MCACTVGEAAQQQKSITAAVEALSNALNKTNLTSDPFEKHNIAKEVAALSDAAKGDEYITQLLSALPEGALADGITSQASLRQRFKHVRKICKRVALVPEEGGGLGLYLLSFLQSLLTIDMVHAKMTDTLTIDADTATVFDLLRYAYASLEQGDLETAVRLVNQLKGESRRVAMDWMDEARLYLETRQIITAISEYISASNISVFNDKN